MSDEGKSPISLKVNAVNLTDLISDIPKLIDENCSDDSSDEEKWDEVDEEDEETKCLFSDKVFPTLDDAISHLKSSYNFDLTEMKQKHSMDFYSYMKVGWCLDFIFSLT